MKHLAIFFTVMLSVLAFSACQPTSRTDISPGWDVGAVENIRLNDGSMLYFPRQPESDGAQMEALLEGLLLLKDGCLRAVTSGYEEAGFLILWPPEAVLHISEDGTIELRDDSDQIIGRVGDPIRIGGGAMEGESSMALWDAQINDLPIEGCPGPYWVAGALYPLAVSGDTSTTQPLATPYSQEPAAGICGEFEGSAVSISLRPDVPDPRCVRVKPDQYLSIKNETDQRLQVSIAHFQTELDPGMETTFETPFGEYLAPGVHQLTTSAPPGGPEIWLVSE
jgi:hypothetical protein